MQGRKGGCGSEGGTLLRKDVEADGLLLAAAGKAALVRDINAVCWWLGCTQEAQASRSCWGPPCWGGPSTYSLASTVTKQQICLRLCFLALSPHGTTAGYAMQAWTLWWCSLDSGRGFFFSFFFLLLLLPLHSPPLLSWLPAAAAPGWWDKGLFLDWEGLEHGGIASVATTSF